MRTSSTKRSAGTHKRGAGADGRRDQRRAAHRKAPRRATAALNGRPDAVTLLRADHNKMRELLDRLKSAAPQSRRQQLLGQVEEALKAHTTIEEEIFYPAFREAARSKKDRQLFHEATEEHHAADMILKEVGRAGTQEEVFAGRVKVLKEIVEHHADEEERDMFPRARQLLPSSEIRRLGEEMVARKRSLGRGDSTLQRVASLVTLPFSSSAS